MEAEFVEVESGRKDDRAQLAAALLMCRRKLGRVLVISKLDRLARSVAFISNLMESGVAFVAVDMHHGNIATARATPPAMPLSSGLQFGPKSTPTRGTAVAAGNCSRAERHGHQRAA